jgi:hypothetical protein
MLIVIAALTALASDPAIGAKSSPDALCAAVADTRDALLQQAILLADSRTQLTDARRAYNFFGPASDVRETQAEIDKANEQTRSVLFRLERAERINRESRERLDVLAEYCPGLVLSPLD